MQTISIDNEEGFGEVLFRPVKGRQYSDDSLATAYTTGKKLVTDPTGNIIHYVFTSAHQVRYSVSTDGGLSWAPDTFLGYGRCPTIALDADNCPNVAWVQLDTTDYIWERERLWYTRYDASLPEPQWLTPVVLYTVITGWEHPFVAFSQPAIVVDNEDVVRLVWESVEGWCAPGGEPNMSEWKVLYGQFAKTNPVISEVEMLDYDQIIGPPPWAGPKSPSLAYHYDPISGNHTHCVWSKRTEKEIYYNEKTSTAWNPTNLNLSQSPDLPSEMPFVEVYGGYVRVVWDEWQAPDVEVRDIRGRENLLGQNWPTFPFWVHQSLDDSRYPQIVAGGYVSWAENFNGTNWETYLKKLSTGQVWDISNTAERSQFPHIAFHQTVTKSKPHFIWTENNSSPYKVTYYQMPAAKTAYYSVGVGQETSSPYTIYRDGYIVYPSGIAIDYAYDELVYRLPWLDPAYNYSMMVVGYHESSGKWNAQVKVDGKMAKILHVEAGIPDTVEINIPLNYYQDDREVELTVRRLTGLYAGIVEITVFQFGTDRKEQGGDGPQSTNTTPVVAEFTLHQNCPNPFKSSTAIAYQLPRETIVNLKIYNIQGQLVRNIVNESQKAGNHIIFWDGKDEIGRKAASGVYFYYLSTENFNATKKLIILR